MTGGSVARAWVVPHDHPSFAGHFPGRPILPGVALLAEVMETIDADAALREAVGATPRLSVCKFLLGVAPGQALTIAIEAGARGVAFEVRDDAARVAASGSFAREPEAS